MKVSGISNNNAIRIK